MAIVARNNSTNLTSPEFGFLHRTADGGHDLIFHVGIFDLPE